MSFSIQIIVAKLAYIYNSMLLTTSYLLALNAKILNHPFLLTYSKAAASRVNKY